MPTEEQIYNLYQKTNSYKQQVPYDFIVEEEKLRIEKLPVNSNLENSLDKLQHFQLAYINRTNTTLPTCYMEALLPALDVENVLYTDDYKEFYDNEKGSDIYAKIHKQVDDILDICEPTRYTPEKLAIICDLYNRSNKQVPLTQIYSKFHPDFSDDKYLSVVNKINTIFNDTKEQINEFNSDISVDKYLSVINTILNNPKEQINKAEIYYIINKIVAESHAKIDPGWNEFVSLTNTKYECFKKDYDEYCKKSQQNMRNRLDSLRDYNEKDKLVKSK